MATNSVPEKRKPSPSANAATAEPSESSTAQPEGATAGLTDAPAAGERQAELSKWIKRRRILVALLLLGFVAAIWVSFQTSYLHTCEDFVARVGKMPLATSCRPLSVTDGPMIALLIVIGILLLPEVSALEIPGVIRLERELKEQGEKQREIMAAINRLEISQHQEFHLNFDAKLGELVGEQAEKRRQFESDAA